MSYDVAGLMAWRLHRDEVMKASYASPIPEDHLEAFTSLGYFEPEPALAVSGTFAARSGKRDIESSTGGITAYTVAGSVTVTVGGETRRLVVLSAEEDEMFVPFSDATCGKESYGGGRYAPVVLTEPGVAMVDFNRAVNPFCAYDPEFSCPLPPPENRFGVAIEAGEKDYPPD